ncbi:MAG: glycosyltransferase [Deltaproteobacteria bacterium]
MSNSFPNIICTISNDITTDRRMQRICESLVDFGSNVTLVGFRKKHSAPLDNMHYKTVRLNQLFNKGFLFYAEINIRLFFFLLKTKFDIVNSVDTDTVLACFLVSKIKNKRIIFDAHEFFPGVPELEGKPFKRFFWQMVERLTLPHIRHNYTVSESLKKLYESQTGQIYQVIRNLPKKSDFSGKLFNQTQNFDKKICYLGALNKGRGLENAIKALKILPVNFKLLLVGGGDLEKTLKSLTIDLDLTERVQITGWVKPSEISHLLGGCHLGLNLLDGNSDSYRVSLANKVFDYIHHSIPCITMNFEEYKKLNEEFNCFVLTDSIEPGLIGRIIIDLFEDNEKYILLCKNAQLASLALNWETESQKLKNIYFLNTQD